MFDKASLKLGLDKAVLQSMGSSKDMSVVGGVVVIVVWGLLGGCSVVVWLLGGHWVV